MPKIAIIDKAPSRNDYSKYFDFEFDLYHMSSVPLPKILKKDIDLVVDLEPYDLVILVGAEASKHYAGVSVTNHSGVLTNGKFIPITNPAMLIFKPEGKPDFERAVKRINDFLNGSRLDAVATGDFKGILNADEAMEFLLEVLHSNAPYVAMDTEGTALYPRDGYTIGVSISYKAKHGRYIIVDVLEQEHLDVLQQIIDRYEIIFHNLKYDVKMLEYHLGLRFREEASHDTMVMHYVLDETDSHSLKVIALKYTDYGDYDAALDDFKKQYCATNNIKEDDFTYDLIPFDIISVYASIDTAVTWEITGKFLPIIKANAKFAKLYRDLLIRGTFFLMRMEEVGIPIARDRIEAAGVYLNKMISDAKAHIYTFEAVKNFEKDSGTIFNPNSVQQLRTVLFDYAGLTPTGKLTATKAISTDAEVLEELSKEHPLPGAILQVRKLTKIRSSYVVKILPALDRDGRIRTNFNLIFTTSGRLSSSGKFNAQQIPRDDPIIKGCIVAPSGYKIVSQDLTTAEMYYAAVLSGDKNLQAVFSTGGDFHSAIAKMVFDLDCPVEEVKGRYGALRQSAKAISFGILYGSGPAKVSESVTKATKEYYPIERAKEDIRTYFEKFKTLKKWLDSRKKFIETNGYTYSFFGRKRRLPNVFSADKGIAAHEVRSGINAEIQSLASDVNLLAAMDTEAAVLLNGIDARIFMLVHDSIVAIVRDDHVEEYCKLLRYHTQKDRGCSIPGAPLGVEQEIGQDYSFGKFEKYYSVEEGMLGKL